MGMENNVALQRSAWDEGSLAGSPMKHHGQSTGRFLWPMRERVTPIPVRAVSIAVSDDPMLPGPESIRCRRPQMGVRGLSIGWRSSSMSRLGSPMRWRGSSMCRRRPSIGRCSSSMWRRGPSMRRRGSSISRLVPPMSGRASSICWRDPSLRCREPSLFRSGLAVRERKRAMPIKTALCGLIAPPRNDCNRDHHFDLLERCDK
jgi:hypothetical protein